MNNRNMLGEICTIRPFRLRYLTDEEKAANLTEHGFPAETKVEDMENDAQRAAYWRDQSKKQQKKTEGIDLDKLKKDSEDLEKLRKANLDDQEKALEEARDEARREGENIGAGRYLTDAVKAKFQTLTGKTDEETETVFAHVDPKSFTDDSGAIDAVKLKAYADTFGTKSGSGNQSDDPVAAALARQRAAGGGLGSSIAEKRKETRESLTKSKA